MDTELNENSITLANTLILTFPQEWRVKRESAIDQDSFKVYLGADSTKYLMICSGFNCPSLTETCPEIIRDTAYYEVVKNTFDFKTGKFKFVNPSGIMDLDIYMKQNVFFKTVSNRTYKLVLPIHEFHGKTGIHFYKIKDETNGIGNYKLSMYGSDLDENETEKFIKIVNNIKWLTDCQTCTITF